MVSHTTSVREFAFDERSEHSVAATCENDNVAAMAKIFSIGKRRTVELTGPPALTRAIIEPDHFDEKLAGGGSGPTICGVASPRKNAPTLRAKANRNIKVKNKPCNKSWAKIAPTT